MIVWRLDCVHDSVAAEVTLFFRTPVAGQVALDAHEDAGWLCDLYEEDVTIGLAELSRLIGVCWPIGFTAEDVAAALTVDPRRAAASRLNDLLGLRSGGIGRPRVNGGRHARQ